MPGMRRPDGASGVSAERDAAPDAEKAAWDWKPWAFDHFVTEVLQAPYVRYVDDFALFHHDPVVLSDWRLRIEHYLAGRRLKLHPRKTMILSCTEPSQFLGFELHADGHRRLPDHNV